MLSAVWQERATGKERGVGKQERDYREASDAATRCSVCGAPTSPTDRFCDQCGASLPATPVEPREDQPGAAGPLQESANPAASITRPDTSAAETSSTPAPREGNVWIFGARPAAVIGGGLLLLLLAAALLFVGQLDDTGTIVMLAICVAPLALLTLAIGIARAIGGAAGRG